MPKKGTGQEESQVSEAAFLKALNAKKAAAAAAAKTERRTGLMDDHAILAKLGVEPDESKTFPGTVSKITFSFAKNDASRPMFRFVYIVESDDKKANGTVLSTQHIIEEGKDKNDVVFRTEEEAMERLFHEFQSLGEDTSSWVKDPFGEAVKAAKAHTRDKTPVSITVKHWTKNDKSGMNVYANTVATDNSDLDDAKTDDGEVYTDVDDSEAFNADDWIGGYCEFDSDDYGHIRMKIESYDADTHTFSGTDTNGDVWSDDYAPSADKVEWSENQDD